MILPEEEMPETTLKIERFIEVEIPPLPPKLKAAGSSRATLGLETFSAEELRAIGQAWTEALMAQAGREDG